MRIINLLCLFLMTALIPLSGCDNNQASSASKTSAIAEKPAAMNFNIIEKDTFTVMGIQTRIISAEQKNPDTYTKIWDAFESYRTQLRPLSIEQRSFGVTFATNKKDAIDYLAGMSVHSDAMAPDINLVSRTVPAARYAVFKCTSQDINKTYQSIYGEWLEKSRYKLDTKACCFEQYAPKEWTNRPVYISIPIVPK